MNSSASLPVRTVPRPRLSSTTSTSVGAGSSAASTPTAQLPPMSLDEIMAAPARRHMPRLHPERPNRPKDVWFGLDSCVVADITSIYTNDFKGAWRSLTMVPRDVQIQWWSKFAQRYYWEVEHHDVVVSSYGAKLRNLLKNLISKGKQHMKKPGFVDPSAWNIMNEHWDTPGAAKKSKTCSGARKSDRSGYGESCHTAGSKSFNKIKYEMAEANNGIMPSIPELVRRTHTRTDGSFADKYAEKVVKDSESLATQMSAPNPDLDDEIDSQGRSSIATPTTDQLNKAYCELVPVVKGQRFGLGSIHVHEEKILKSLTTPSTPRDVEFVEMKGTVASLVEKFDILQKSVDLIVQGLTGGLARPTPPTSTD